MESYQVVQPVNTNIQLTELEGKIFETLMQIVNEHQLKTTMRVAGGWVRDKLMGKESADIDIALDDMFGAQMAELVNQHLYPGNIKYGIIPSNNEKSKHLETATIKVHGIFIDFVNLRSEKYTDNSRIPQIDIGTPEEDAYRRDLTINTMFYNINSKQVEDFTKVGISDLMNGLIRTPLEPLQTFLDDPLRVLRTVRFATRFQFKIIPDILIAAKDERVREALHEKVSHERLGKEMDLMLEGKYPHHSIEYLYEFGVIQLLYKFPKECKELEDQQLVQKLIFQSLRQSQLIGHLMITLEPQVQSLFIPAFPSTKVEEKNNENKLKEFQKSLFYSVLLSPFAPYEYKIKKKTEKVIVKVLTESLKKSNEILKFVMGTVPYIDQMIEYSQKFYQKQQLGEEKLKFGQFLRDAGHKRHSICLIALAQEYYNLTKSEIMETSFIPNEEIIKELIQRYSHLVELIKREKLDNVHNWKTLIDGKTICDMYEINPGKILRSLIDEQLNFMINNPDCSLEEVKTYMMGKKSEFISKYEGSN